MPAAPRRQRSFPPAHGGANLCGNTLPRSPRATPGSQRKYAQLVWANRTLPLLGSFLEPFLEIDTWTAALSFHPTAHAHPSFQTERADFFFPVRSCELVGSRREKSLFLIRRPDGQPSTR